VNSHNERQAQRKFEEEEILFALYSKDYTAGTRRISAHPKFPGMRLRNFLQKSCIRTIPNNMFSESYPSSNVVLEMC
jgi:hypothetical protein